MKISLPDRVFNKYGEIICNEEILQLSISEKIPVLIIDDKNKERVVNPLSLLAVDGDRYLIGVDSSEGILSTFRLDEISFILFIQGNFSHSVVDILNNNANSSITNKQKNFLLKNRIKLSQVKRENCCTLKPGENLVGKLLEDGVISIHSFDCPKAAPYWW